MGKKKASRASEKKLRRDKRKARGLCPECGNTPDDPDFIICSKCRKRILASVNARRAKVGKPVHKQVKPRGHEDDEEFNVSPEEIAERAEYVKTLSLIRKRDAEGPRGLYPSVIEPLPHPTDSHGTFIYPSSE